jgi:hypothetical protein
VTKPSPHEIYDTKEGRQKRLIFEPQVDLSNIPSRLNLTKLGLFNIKLDILHDSTNLTSLTHLYLENVTLLCTIEKFTVFISGLTNLTMLSVKDCKFITDHMVVHINRLPRLAKLWCTNSGIVTTSSIRKGIIVA